MYRVPAEFDSYWRETLDELGKIDMTPELELIPLRSTDFAELYGVQLSSFGDYRVYGFLSIPTGPTDASESYPAIYFTPRYQSVVQPIPQGTSNVLRRHFVTFSLAARGQRNADKTFAADFPGWLTTDIADAEKYIFRGVVADCVRGLEFLSGQDQIDPARIAVVGNDLALITAALGNGATPRATHVASTPELFFGHPETGEGYPRAEINDHLRLATGDAGPVRRTLALFDLRAFALSAPAPRLITAGPIGSAFECASLAPLAAPAQATLRQTEQSLYKDGVALMTWLAAQFGMPNPSAMLPPAWK
jgi:cephalosporin-C deacetylase